MRIIPAIDLKDGKCVRLLKGDYAQTTEYSNDPAEVGRRFSALDVAELHIVDLDGARTGKQENRALVAAIAAESGLAIQLGGGIRTRNDVASWLQNGVARCVIGSIAIKEPDTVCAWLDEFGADAIVLALDVRITESGVPLLSAQGWTDDSDITLWDRLDAFGMAGARHVLCTDISRDGAMSGPNFDLYQDLLSRFPKLSLQASGGVRHIGDLLKLREMRIPAAITGRALLDGAITPAEVVAFRRSA